MVATNNGQGQQNRIDIHPQRDDNHHDAEDVLLQRLGKYGVVGSIVLFALIGVVVVCAIAARLVLGILD